MSARSVRTAIARPYPRLAVWPLWIAASTVGTAFGVLAILGLVSLGELIVGPASEDRLFGLFLVPMLAISLAVPQWLVIRRYLPAGLWWAIACAVGFSGGMYLLNAITALLLGHFGIRPASIIIPELAVLGLTTGLAGWLYLHGRVARAGWWIAASVAAWLLVGLFLPQGSVDGPYLLVPVFGTIPAAVTGGVLTWLLRQRAD